jgi:hypothetical protein
LRGLSTLVLTLFILTQVQTVLAHGGETSGGGLSWWHGAAVSLLGVAVLTSAVLLKRREVISPTYALYAVFVGILTAVVGIILFDGLSPEVTYTADSMPFPRSWYPFIGLSIGSLIATASFVIGWLRWPERPRYAFLGILMGLWVAYPYLIPMGRGYSNPLGYAIVLGTPVLVGYILWKDAGFPIRELLKDSVARRFGIGVGLVVALFFASMTGYLTVFPEEEAPQELTVAVLPAVYQLVSWPTLEVFVPRIPFFFAASPGQIVVIGTLGLLVGLNAGFIAYQWRIEEKTGLAEVTGGSASVVGSCTCGCCGPFVAKAAVLAAGPAVAAPLYWLFVDSASPLTSLFTAGAIVLFTGSLVYSVKRFPSSASTS